MYFYIAKKWKLMLGYAKVARFDIFSFHYS